MYPGIKYTKIHGALRETSKLSRYCKLINYLQQRQFPRIPSLTERIKVFTKVEIALKLLLPYQSYRYINISDLQFVSIHKKYMIHICLVPKDFWSKKRHYKLIIIMTQFKVHFSKINRAIFNFVGYDHYLFHILSINDLYSVYLFFQYQAYDASLRHVTYFSYTGSFPRFFFKITYIYHWFFTSISK